jgi:type III pantothenate kinase
LKLIALDVGNGSIKWGRFEAGRLLAEGRWPLDAEPPDWTADAALFGVSVNPAVEARWKAARPGLQRLGRELPLPLEVHYRPPADCGADRVAAAAGALFRLPEADAVLVFDAGTCLVATLAHRKRGVLGGAILPGRDLMARALSEGTAALPLIEIAEPQAAVGASTAESIRVGIDAALVGATRELIRRMTGDSREGCAVVATGTGGATLATRVGEIRAHIPLLPLWGVYAAAARSDRSR